MRNKLLALVLGLALSGCSASIQTVSTPSNSHATLERPQRTGKGVIVSAFERYQTTLSSQGWYLGFTFEQVDGFQKTFFPVCDGTTLVTGQAPVVMLYHWHSWQNVPDSSTDSNGSLSNPNRLIGCYAIDGRETEP